MELDALYCDVITQRWERFTGRKANRLAASKESVPLVQHAGKQKGVAL